MSLYKNIAGTWTLIKQPSVHHNGSFVPLKKAFIHANGIWNEYFSASVEPPPELPNARWLGKFTERDGIGVYISDKGVI